MSLVNYYKCDICDKEFKKDELMHFKRERTKLIECYSRFTGYYKDKEDEIKDFDICEKCFARIVIEIKKEGAE